MLGVARLTNGIILAIYGPDGLRHTMTPLPVKGWNDWALMAGEGSGISDPGNNKLETFVDWHFDTHPLTLRDGAGEFMALYSQDDLDGLTALRAAVQGHVDAG